jgi:hypothetical protein
LIARLSVIEPASDQLLKRGPGLLDEHLRHRALARRRLLPLDLLADRLGDPRELPRRHSGEHPIHHRPLQRVPTSEVLIRRDRQLPLGRPDPRTTDRHPPTTQRHRPILVAMTLRCPVRIPLPPRSDDLVDLGFHQLMHNPQPHTHAQRKQSLAGSTDELAERFLNLRRELRRITGFSSDPITRIPHPG